MYTQNSRKDEARLLIERKAIRQAMDPEQYLHVRDAITGVHLAITGDRKAIWAAISSDPDKGPDVWRNRVAHSRPGAVEEFEEILSMDLPSEDYAGLLLGVVRERRMDTLAERSVALLQEGVDYDTVIAGLRSEIDKLETGATTEWVTDPAQQQADVEEYCRANPQGAFEIPWQALRRHMRSVNPGEIITVAGEEGSGKTSVIDALALLAAHAGLKVDIKSTEMSAIHRRIGLAAQRHAAFNKASALNRITLSSDRRLQRSVIDSTQMLLAEYGDRLTIDDRDSYTAAQMLRSVRSSFERGYQVVVIDHTLEIDFEAGKGRLDLAVDKWMHGIMTMARRYNGVIILAHQLNRSDRDPWTAPQLKNLAEAPSVARKAHRAIFVWRPQILATRGNDGNVSLPSDRAQYVYLDSAADLNAIRADQKGRTGLLGVPAPGIMALTLRKDRVEGNVGKEARLWYDPASGRITDPGQLWTLGKEKRYRQAALPITDGDTPCHS